MKTQPTAPREAAFTVLESANHGAWSDGTLKSVIRSAGLSGRDSALCSRICYGVQQNQLLLDFWISKFSKVPVHKLESVVRTALRMGLYQTALMDRIPERAAVNESVELVKKFSKNPNSSRLTNGILRSFCRQKENLPQPDSLSVKYSHPQWLVDLFAGELKDERSLEELLQADNGQPPTTIQVNTLKTDAATLTKELEEQGVSVTPHPWLEGCLELTGTGSIEELPQFVGGGFLVQDAAARLAAIAADPQPGWKVLDACAAPGGKSFAAAMAMGDKGELTSCDIHPKKVKLIRSGAKRLGITMLRAEVANGREFRPEWENAFDLVIADVPCSGLGIIRKKPDIRYKEPEALGNLPAIQQELLENLSRYVKPGGVLLYSTCTVLRRENQQNVMEFLSRHREFSLDPFTLPKIGTVEEGMLTLWPHIHGTDGFFMAKMGKST